MAPNPINSQGFDRGISLGGQRPTTQVRGRPGLRLVVLGAYDRALSTGDTKTIDQQSTNPMNLSARTPGTPKSAGNGGPGPPDIAGLS